MIRFMCKASCTVFNNMYVNHKVSEILSDLELQIVEAAKLYIPDVYLLYLNIKKNSVFVIDDLCARVKL